MASKADEDDHVRMLNELMMKAGLECQKPHESMTTIAASVVEEEEPIHTADEAIKEEVTAEEEELFEEELEPQADEPEIFPSPSLKRLVTDKQRKIENYNRIHSLPEEFLTDIDPLCIPKIATTPQQTYIDVLAGLVGCKEYKSSLAEFWFLDTMANLLRRAQTDNLDRPTQAVLILWFCEWMKEMEQFDAADRERMLRRFKDNMFSAAKYIAEEERLPTPKEVKVYYKAMPDDTLTSASTGLHPLASKNLVTFQGAAYECSMKDLICILHYIYDLFNTDYQYDLVRSVFTFSPDYQRIDDPYQINNPKRMYVPLKVKPAKSPKPQKLSKAAKGKKDVITEEFLALMELKANEERELEELEQLSREDYNRRSHLLPLAMAAGDEIFDKYWPPPIPDPEPEPTPQARPPPKKGKK